MQKRSLVALALALGTGLLFLVGCSRSQPEPSTGGGDTPPGQEEPQEQEQQQDEQEGAAQHDEGKIVVRATDFKFEPSTIEIKAGEEVTIEFHNEGALFHDMVAADVEAEVLGMSGMAGHPEADDGDMDGMDMGGTTEEAGHDDDGDDGNDDGEEPPFHVNADPGTTATLTLVITKPGTYEFICTIPGHKEAGMEGVLVVK